MKGSSAAACLVSCVFEGLVVWTGKPEGGSSSVESVAERWTKVAIDLASKSEFHRGNRVKSSIQVKLVPERSRRMEHEPSNDHYNS